jgi:hypothetical protein
MKGSAITGPVGKECADIWPKVTILADIRLLLLQEPWYKIKNIYKLFFDDDLIG